MDLHDALAFATARRNAILTTLRRDGRPQQSMIFYRLEEGVATISLTADRAKTKNLTRDPRATLFIPGDHVFSWVCLDGTVALSPVATDPHDAVVEELVAYYRAANGEHEDWDSFRAAMVAEGRLVAHFTATSATGLLGD